MASSQGPVDPVLKKAYEEVQEHLKVLQEAQTKKQKLVESRHQLTSQKNENDLVKSELTNLEEGAAVFKLIGPVLVEQSATDASTIVEKRLDYISEEIKRTDREYGECERTEMSIKDKIVALQKRMELRQAEIMQAHQNAAQNK